MEWALLRLGAFGLPDLGRRGSLRRERDTCLCIGAGSDGDRDVKPLIQFAAKGALSGANSHFEPLPNSMRLQ